MSHIDDMAMRPNRLLPSKKERLANMYNDEKYSDCLVRVGPVGCEESFRANRTLLARCSEVFGKMFFEQCMQEERDAEVHIADCSGVAFRALLQCAHDLEPVVDDKNFVEVFQLGRKYEVEELMVAVQRWMDEASSIPTMALRALDAAESLSESIVEEEVAEMLAACINTVVSNGEELLDDDAFLSCTPWTLRRLLQQERFRCDEEHLWMSLVKWGKLQAEGEGSLRALTPFVRFNLMSPEFFVDNVVSAGILEDTQVVSLLSARATGREAVGFHDVDIPRCGIFGAQWRRSTLATENFELSNRCCTLSRTNYPHWKRALGRWNCDDFMQQRLLTRCNASFSVRIDNLVTQKGRYSGDILLGVARQDVPQEEFSDTRNNAAPAWVYSCSDGALVAPCYRPTIRMTPSVVGDVLRFELRAGMLFIFRNGEPMGCAFEDIAAQVFPVVEMNLAGSRVTLC
mmetsp:Transcript_89852/g.253395  ORF Transcript_89852/g.253395 Transcript_89852/m.253395 type:complete len:458 (+) Transcript_89852:96-1469(+)